MTTPETLRITAKDALSIIRCVIATHRKSNPKKEIPVEWVSGLCGVPGNEYCELRAGGYYLNFTYRGGILVACRTARTPSGREWHSGADAGEVFSQLNLEDVKCLTRILLDKKKEALEISVVPAWIVVVGNARPYAAHLFYSEEEAQVAMLEQMKHYKKYSGGKIQAKTEAKEVKEQVKEANSVPYGKIRKK